MDSCCNSSLVQLYKPSPAGFSATVRSAFVVGLTLLWTVAAEVHASGLPVTVDGQALPSLAPMLERVTPAVVNIAVSGKASIRNNRLMSDPAFKHFFKREQRTGSQPKQSLGSGVIIDASKGLVLTNHHLVEGAGAIVVNTRDGRVLRATLVGLDDETDLAVIRVLAERLSAVPLADSDALRVGDFVVAIGNPFGLGQTVTSGIVSALSRSGLGIRGYEDFIQTDASINVGNSGGALVNLRGELVGINTAIFSPGGGSVGIGFAIPIRMAMSVASQLISFGHVKRGALGVAAINLTAQMANRLGLDGTAGAVIDEVAPGSPAHTAGLTPGDVLTRVNGRVVRNAAQVRTQLGTLRAGEEVVMELIRGTERVTVSAVLRARRNERPEEKSLHHRLVGASFVIPGAAAEQGVIVSAVQPRSPAAQLGLRVDDVITAVNKRKTQTPEQLRGAMKQRPPITLSLVRDGHVRVILVR